MGDPTMWNFWLADADRNSGWSNHTYCLQFVTFGHGDSPKEAWLNADVPDGFRMPAQLIAIRSDDEVVVEVEDRRATKVTPPDVVA